MSVQAGQRFTRDHPCPICGCYEGAVRHQGRRCYGFASDDGAWAHCTREEHAGPLTLHDGSMTYAHRLSGPCKCGIEHGQYVSPPYREEEPRRRTRSSEPLGTPVAWYVYEDADGTPVHRTVRFAHPKSFRQQHLALSPERGWEWAWGLGDVSPVLYRLPALLAAPRDIPVFLAEGEKDCDRLSSLGLVATTNPMGAKNWRAHYGDWLRGRSVIVLEDNDSDGRERTARLRSVLCGVVRSLEVVSFPNLPNGGDVSDWLDRGGDVRELLISTLAVSA